VKVLVLVDHDRGVLDELTLQAMTAARSIGSIEAVVMGAYPALAPILAEYGAQTVHVVTHDLLSDYGSEAWADALVQVMLILGAQAIAPGTDRGNEVMAHVGALLNSPVVANCNEITAGDGDWSMVRTRWGGSLLEETTLTADRKLLTITPHAVVAEPAPAAGTVQMLEVELDEAVARTIVADRVTADGGITLQTAPVVVAGGRGVGNPENFAALDELAGLIGGAVGCSRVVTNNGWRSHAEQVGQTGTRVAPDLYIACGISGAIQHWVGMMGSKRVLAINTDREAPMVTKADYAVIGDVNEIVPAVIAAIKAR
jgi:electron transfer flavoprotein alpha subunit